MVAFQFCDSDLESTYEAYTKDGVNFFNDWHGKNQRKLSDEEIGNGQVEFRIKYCPGFFDVVHPYGQFWRQLRRRENVINMLAFGGIDGLRDIVFMYLDKANVGNFFPPFVPFISVNQKSGEKLNSRFYS